MFYDYKKVRRNLESKILANVNTVTLCLDGSVSWLNHILDKSRLGATLTFSQDFR